MATPPRRLGFMKTLPDFPDFITSCFSTQFPDSTPIAECFFHEVYRFRFSTIIRMFKMNMKCKCEIFLQMRTSLYRVHMCVRDKGIGSTCLPFTLPSICGNSFGIRSSDRFCSLVLLLTIDTIYFTRGAMLKPIHALSSLHIRAHVPLHSEATAAWYLELLPVARCLNDLRKFRLLKYLFQNFVRLLFHLEAAYGSNLLFRLD